MGKGKKKLERAIAKEESYVQSLARFLYDGAMFQCYQTVDECDHWADILRAIADAVELDYGSKSQ